jgi:hypothetical protein
MQLDIPDMLCGDDAMREMNPVAVMLVAMLVDQIQSLGRYYYDGMWREDPAELSEWLRRDTERMMSSPQEKGTYMREEATREWQLWGRATDVLLAVLERDTVVRIDRGRIVALAKRAGAKSGSRNIDPEQRRRNKQRENARYKAKIGGPRAVREPRLYRAEQV